MMAERISWDEYFAELATLVARRSPCHRLHVGCVLVKDKHIIATGYNGFLPGAEHKSIVAEGHEQATVHAEQNCVADCARRGVSTVGATAYITHYPCVSCYKSLVSAGVAKIHFLNDYNNSPIVPLLVESCNVPVDLLKAKGE